MKINKLSLLLSKIEFFFKTAATKKLREKELLRGDIDSFRRKQIDDRTMSQNYSVLLKHFNQPNTYIHFSSSFKFGIMPKSSFRWSNPYAIYAYPFNAEFLGIYQKGLFGTARKYIHLIRGSGKILDMSKYTKQDLYNDFVKIIKHTPDFIKYIYDIHDDEFYKGADKLKIIKSVVTKTDNPPEMLWDTLSKYSQSLDSFAFAKLLSTLDYSVILDPNLSIINTDIPAQALFIVTPDITIDHITAINNDVNGASTIENFIHRYANTKLVLEDNIDIINKYPNLIRYISNPKEDLLEDLALRGSVEAAFRIKDKDKKINIFIKILNDYVNNNVNISPDTVSEIVSFILDKGDESSFHKIEPICLHLLKSRVISPRILARYMSNPNIREISISLINSDNPEVVGIINDLLRDRRVYNYDDVMAAIADYIDKAGVLKLDLLVCNSIMENDRMRAAILKHIDGLKATDIYELFKDNYYIKTYNDVKMVLINEIREHNYHILNKLHYTVLDDSDILNALAKAASEGNSRAQKLLDLHEA